MKEKTSARLIFDAYPHKIFTETITEISKAPHKENGTTHYLASIPIDNTKHIFRPGMTINARITVAEKEDVIAVPKHAFKLSKNILKKIAQVKKLGFKPIDSEEKETLLLKDNIKTFWLFKDNAFVEHPVEVGINDNAFFEIVSGLDCSEAIVIDTAEPDGIKKFFERFLGKES